MADSLRSRGWLVLEPTALISVESLPDAAGVRRIHVDAIDPTGQMSLPAGTLMIEDGAHMGRRP